VKVAKGLAGALLLALFAVGVRAQEQEGLDALFSVSMKDIQGEPMTLSQFRGKPLIVSFWARWCVPCREEFPEFMALRKKYKKQGLAVVGVALEENPEKVREFLVAYQVDYPSALIDEKEGHSLMKPLGNEDAVLPYTLLIDRKGEIVLSKRGVFRKSDFQGVSKKLLR
jgi:thiol-disulfide isomerase/thioredoxin